MTQSSIREYTEAVRERYLRGSKKEAWQDFGRIHQRSSVVIDRQLLGCSVMVISQGQAKGVGVLDGIVLLSELAGLILRNSMK
jgi:hypothetical protein